jgi:hypothetical protein
LDSDDEPETLARLAQAVAALEQEDAIRADLVAFRAQRQSRAVSAARRSSAGSEAEQVGSTESPLAVEGDPDDAEPGDAWALFHAKDEQEAVALAHDPATPPWALRRYMWSGEFEEAKAVIRQRLEE